MSSVGEDVDAFLSSRPLREPSHASLDVAGTSLRWILPGGVLSRESDRGSQPNSQRRRSRNSLSLMSTTGRLRSPYVNLSPVPSSSRSISEENSPSMQFKIGSPSSLARNGALQWSRNTVPDQGKNTPLTRGLSDDFSLSSASSITSFNSIPSWRVLRQRPPVVVEDRGSELVVDLDSLFSGLSSRLASSESRSRFLASKPSLADVVDYLPKISSRRKCNSSSLPELCNKFNENLVFADNTDIQELPLPALKLTTGGQGVSSSAAGGYTPSRRNVTEATTEDVVKHSQSGRRSRQAGGMAGAASVLLPINYPSAAPSLALHQPHIFTTENQRLALRHRLYQPTEQLSNASSNFLFTDDPAQSHNPPRRISSVFSSPPTQPAWSGSGSQGNNQFFSSNVEFNCTTHGTNSRVPPGLAFSGTSDIVYPDTSCSGADNTCQVESTNEIPEVTDSFSQNRLLLSSISREQSDSSRNFSAKNTQKTWLDHNNWNNNSQASEVVHSSRELTAGTDESRSSNQKQQSSFPGWPKQPSEVLKSLSDSEESTSTDNRSRESERDSEGSEDSDKMGIRISQPQVIQAKIVAPAEKSFGEKDLLPKLDDRRSENRKTVLLKGAVRTTWLSRRRKVLRTGMREVAAQTDEVDEDELDWDLSDRVDRETQTLPPNPTAFQLNRTDAMVQTDYRYFPLMSESDLRRQPEVAAPNRTYRDVGTQTERTTSSVSTQTEDVLLQANEHPPVASESPPSEPPTTPSSPRGEDFGRPQSNLIQITPYNSCRKDRTLSSARRSSSVESSAPAAAAFAVAAIFRAGITSASSPSLNDALGSLGSQDSDVTAPLRAPQDGAMSLRPRKDAMAVWDSLGPIYLNELMPVIKAGHKFHKIRRKMVDVSVQTDLKAQSDEPTEFAPRPPTCRKRELLRKLDINELDTQALTAPREVSFNLDELVTYLFPSYYDDLQKVRVIFRWITDNIRYDWKFVERPQSAEEVLLTKAGVSKDFVALLLGMCEQANVRAKRIQGVARSRDFRVGRRFDPQRDVLHYWAVVFIFDSWRLIDPTYGAGYTDAQGRYHPVLQEHYFLPDPDTMIYTHFPYYSEDSDYFRWQLMDVPVSLDVFNNFPALTPYFWEHNLRLRTPKTSPVVFAQQTELQLASSTYIRYKYKFFPADQTEEHSMNQFVFCTLKEGGAVVSFLVNPANSAPHVLRIMARPEDAMESDETPLEHVASFLLLCTKPRKYFVPWPVHDGAWGPNPRLYQCGLDLVSESGPLLVSWGGRKHLTFEKAFDVLLMFQLFDKEGNNIDLKSVLKKDESEYEIHVSIVPPSVGFYKLLMFGIPRPQVRGRWRLPLLACYLIESKMNVSPHQDKKNNHKKRERIKLKVRAR